MGTFVNSTDFKEGELKISQTTDSQDSLETYIVEAELEVLQELFGSELYELFTDDLDNGVPQTQRFIDVFEPFYDDEDVLNYWCSGAFRSEGIKVMLMRFIYVAFTNDQPNQNSPEGTVRNEFANSKAVNGPAYGIDSKYNKGVKSYQAIARKMILDTSTYPEYNGIAKSIVSMI